MLAASSQQSQRSMGAESNNEFYTPQPTPPLPSSRRADVALRERQKPPSSDLAQSGKVESELEVPRGAQSVASTQPTQPPTSPLPAIPKAAESKAPPPESDTKQAETTSDETKVPSGEGARSDDEDDVEERPGLGPMVKKKPKEFANTLRKAAFAYGAFKPRAGGAAEKLFNKETKNSDEPDGIKGVVPAPSRVIGSNEPEKAPETEKRSSKDLPKVDTSVPSFNILSPLSQPDTSTPGLEPKETPLEKQNTQPEPETRKKKRRSNQQVMNISKLGIDPSLLEGRGLEFEALLSDFGWGSSELSSRNLETVEAEIRREIARVEAGSWLTHLEQKDERVETVERLLDRAIAECDELEGLLTLYNVELSVSLIHSSLTT